MKPNAHFSLPNIFVGLLALLVFASCFSSRKSIAIEDGWDLLGEQRVNFIRDKDAIDVNSSNMFTIIKFKVEDREVRLNNLKITLENGDVIQPALDDIIPADQYSRDITVATEGRFIKKIEFTYRTTGNVLRGRANILVFGKRYNPGY